MKFLPIIFSLLSFFCFKISAQTTLGDVQTFVDSTSTRNFLHTQFDNNVQSAGLISKLNLYFEKGKYELFLRNYFTSSVTKLDENLFRDFENLKIGVKYKLTDKLKLVGFYSGNVYSDEKNVQLKGSNFSSVGIGEEYETTIKGAELRAVTNAAYRRENQLDEINRGIDMNGEINLSNFIIEDYFTDLNLRAGYQNLDPRKNNFLKARLQIDKNFSNELASNQFDAAFSHSRKDFYFPADPITKINFGVNNNIEKRNETILRFFDRFDYTINDNMIFYLTLYPYYRNVRKENQYISSSSTTSPSIYDTQVQDLDLGGDAAIRFDGNKFGLELKTTYNEKDQKFSFINNGRINPAFISYAENLELSKNNHTGLFMLSGTVYYDLTKKNRFEISSSASILKYDTQAETNYDDRDELNYLVYLAHRYNNFKNFVQTTSIDLNLYHTVYIFSQKSSNNNWNRILRLTSRNYFTPSKWLRNIGTFSVLANYTVYDFEDLLSTVKSYSFRQVNLKDSLIITMNKYFGLDNYGELKLYERGELKWTSFATKPTNYFEDKVLTFRLNYFLSNSITLSAGYRYYKQKRFNYVNGERIFDTDFRTYGPMVRALVYWKNSSRLEIIYSYDFIDFSNNLTPNRNSTISFNAYVKF